MAAYLEAVIEDSPGEAARIAKALGDIALAKAHINSCKDWRVNSREAA